MNLLKDDRSYEAHRKMTTLVSGPAGPSRFLVTCLIEAGLALALACLLALIAPLAPTASAATQADKVIVHVVKKGETLSSIAKRYGVTVKALASYNGISVNARLATGVFLKVPPAKPIPTPTPTPKSNKLPDLLPTSWPQAGSQ